MPAQESSTATIATTMLHLKNSSARSRRANCLSLSESRERKRARPNGNRKMFNGSLLSTTSAHHRKPTMQPPTPTIPIAAETTVPTQWAGKINIARPIRARAPSPAA